MNSSISGDIDGSFSPTRSPGMFNFKYFSLFQKFFVFVPRTFSAFDSFYLSWNRETLPEDRFHLLRVVKAQRRSNSAFRACFGRQKFCYLVQKQPKNAKLGHFTNIFGSITNYGSDNFSAWLACLHVVACVIFHKVFCKFEKTWRNLILVDFKLEGL